MSRNNHPLPIAIIGDGFTAAALTYHLLTSGIAAKDMTIFGKHDLGHGRAYGTDHDEFRLNVRAELMQLDDRHPDDFKQWATQNIQDPDARTDAGDFFRRRDYARYISAKLNEALEGQKLQHQKQHITDITASDHGWQLTADDGQTVHAKIAIMGTGNPPSNPSFEIPPSLKSKVNMAPWTGQGFDLVKDHDHVAIIGGGLTGLDIVTALCRSSHKGRISLITPGGHLPPQQLYWTPERAQALDYFPWEDANSASRFAHLFLKNTRKSPLDDVSEQERFEALRIKLNEYWGKISLSDRGRLLQKFGWIWQKIRYRSTPQSHHAIRTLRSEHRFDLISGRVRRLSDRDGKPYLDIDGAEDITPDLVFLATGRGEDPLISTLTQRGEVASPFQTDETHRVLTDSPQKSLFALGPPTLLSQGDVLGASTIAKLAQHLAQTIKEQHHG